VVSQSAKYALSVLKLLAEQPGKRIQTRDIAGETGIPAHYLAKIMSQLTGAGLVDGRKGWGGGFVLATGSGRQPLLRVVELFDGLPDPDECLFGLQRCSSSRPCPLHQRWAGVRKAFRSMLADARVRDLAASPDRQERIEGETS
jgi:Rrf2 family transcriptional regulator, iron-sulfur cluster assembly transcription factor